MAVNWTDAELNALLKIWGTERVQGLLRTARRNKHIYEIVSRELSKVGIERKWKQCRDRVKNLLAKYRKTKDINSKSGEGTATCPFYDVIDAIVGSRPISAPQLVLQSANDDEVQAPQLSYTQEEDEQQSISESNSVADGSGLESEGHSPGMHDY